MSFNGVTVVIICAIVFVVLDSLNLHLEELITDIWKAEQFIFSIVFLILAVTILLLLLWVILDDTNKRSTNQNLRRILNNQPLELDEDTEIHANLSRLSKKMTHLTTNLQNTENERIQNSQEIVKQEIKTSEIIPNKTKLNRYFFLFLVLKNPSTMKKINIGD